MENSVVGTTFDLLAYEGSGSFSKFDRCFVKSCRYYMLDLDGALHRKLRNFAFHYLRVTGFIDVISKASSSAWIVAPPTIIQREGDHFCLISDSKAVEALVQAVGSSRVACRPQSNPAMPLPEGVQFYPNLIEFSADVQEASSIAAQCGMRLSLGYQDMMFEHLPGMDAVLSKALETAPDGPLFEPDSTSIYDFKKAEWAPYPNIRPMDPGLFRKEYEHGSPDYYVAARLTKRLLNTWQVSHREWALFCMLGKLNLTISARYSKDKLTLELPCTHRTLGLPTLLERCLRSGTLASPRITRDLVSYEGITQKNFWRLVAKFPPVKVEQA